MNLLLNIMNTFLITGGAGFVGSYLAINIKNSFSNCHVIALDNLKDEVPELNISRLQKQGVEFVHGDVRNQGDLSNFNPNWIIDYSAEPSVQAGKSNDMDYLIHTNLLGTYHCLQLASKVALILILSQQVVFIL